MAENAVIGALRVVLGADTAAFSDGLKNATRDMEAFHRTMGRAALAIGTVMAAAATALGVSLQSAINRADEMGKMAQRIGIPVEELSRLRLAADLSGVSMESVGVAVGRLSRNMSQIAGGATNDAANAFRALHISVTNASGGLKSSQQIMEEVADRFQRMQDGAGKTALAMAIFGRSGAQMIPMLNQGAAGLREAAREAEELGLVIDQKTARAAEAFNDNLRRLRLVSEGVALQVVAQLAPALQLLSNQFVQAAKDGDVVNRTASGVMTVIDTLGRIVLTTSHFFSQFGRELSALSQVFTAKSLNDLTAAWSRYNQVSSEAFPGLERIRTSFQDFREQADMLARNFENTTNAVTRVAAPVIAAQNALDQFFKAQTKSIAAQQAEASTVGMVAGAREALRLVMQAEAVAQENNIRLTDALRERMAFLAGEARNAALQTAGHQLVLENRSPLEQYQLALLNIEASMRAVNATSEQMGRAQEKVAERFGLTWNAIGSNIAGTAGALSQLTGTFAKENKAMGIASKAFGIAQVIINTQIAITKALATLPPPASYVAVGLAVAQGAASLAAISAQKFATGGSFMVPGGVSGTDNRFVPLNLASGERVTVEPAGDVARGRGGRVPTVSLTLVGKSYDREQLIDMVRGFNEIARDGYIIEAKVAA